MIEYRIYCYKVAATIPQPWLATSHSLHSLHHGRTSALWHLVNRLSDLHGTNLSTKIKTEVPYSPCTGVN